MKLIKKLENFKLVYDELNLKYIIVKCPDELSGVEIVSISIPNTKITPNICSYADNLQTYIVSYEDYKKFIQLVDEAYDLIEAFN